MTTHTTKVNKQKLSLALLAVTLCLALFVGAISVWSQFAAAEEITFLKAELTATTVYDDYTVDTIKNAIKVVGYASEDATEGQRLEPSQYTVKFLGAGDAEVDKLTAGDGNSVRITYGSASCTLSLGTVTAATYTPKIVVSGYSKVGNYYVDGEGYDAFVQGMAKEKVEARLAVALVSVNPHAEPQVLPFADSRVSWTDGDSISDTFGDSSSTVNLSVNISLTVDGYDQPATETINFNTLHAVALALGKQGDNEWPQPDGLKSSSSINAAFIESLQGYVYYRMNNGELGGIASAYDALRNRGVIGATADALLNKQQGDTYDKTVTIETKDAFSHLKPLTLDLKDIIYVAPTNIIGIDGELPDQIARSTELNYGNLSVAVKYSSTTTYIPLNDFIAAGQKVENVKYYIDEQETGLLTRQVNRVTFDCGEYSYDGEVTVARLAQDSPIIDDEELVFSDDCSTTINGLVIDDILGDNMQVTIVEGADGIDSIVDGKITFNRGGTYKVAVSFEKENSSDFFWDITSGGGQLDPSGKVVAYTIVVTNAPIDVTLNFPATLQYGDKEPNLASIVSGTVKGSPSMSMEGLGTQHKADTPVYDNDNPNMGLTKTPNYRVVYSGTYVDDNDKEVTYTDKYKFPTARGSYSVYIETEPTSYYLTGKSEAVSFTIEKRQVSLSAVSIQSKVFTLGVSYNIPDASGNVGAGEINLLEGNAISVSGLVNGDTVANVMYLSTTATAPFTHAGTYKIKFEITSKNYKWENDKDYKEEDFVITARTLGFNLSQDGMTYGSALPAANINGKRTDNKPNGDAADFDDYVTLSATYKNTADNSVVTAPTGSALWQAGNYSVTYAATPKTGVNADDIICQDKTDAFTVARKQLTKADVSGTDGGTYTGTAFTYNIDNWTAATSGIVSGVDTIADVLTIAASGVLFNSNAVTTNITNAQNGVITVVEAGTYTFTVSIESDNYAWDDGTTDNVEKTFTINQKELELHLDLPENGYFFDGTAHVPDMLSQTLIDADLTYSWSGVTYYSLGGGATEVIAANDIIPVGVYRVQIGGFAIAKLIGGEYSYAVNYKLPDNAYCDYEIHVTTVIKPVFDTTVIGVTTTDEATVTYDGTTRDITDYIANWNKYLYLNGAKQTVVIAITLGENTATLRNAGSYTITVTPADNYTWSDGGTEAVELSFTIDQLAIAIDWTDATLGLTYNGTARAVTGYKLNVKGSDSIDVTLSYKQDDRDVSPVNHGSYGVEATAITGSDAANYTLTGATNKTNTLVINKYSIAVPTISSTNVTFGSESQVDFTLQATPAIKDFTWAAVVGATVSGAWKFDGITYGAHEGSSYAFQFVADSGRLVFIHAGEYVITFNLLDTANYQWVSEANLTQTLTVNRKQIVAPSMEYGAGEDSKTYRTIEYKGDSSNNPIVQYPQGLTAGNVKLQQPLFGIGMINVANDSALSSTAKSADYGLYYIKISIATDSDTKYDYRDYEWLQTTDTMGMSNLAQQGANWGTIVYGATENSVYLHYMITRGILYVEYAANGYTFGDNGANGSLGHEQGKLSQIDLHGRTDGFALQHTRNYQTVVTSGGVESLVFYQFANKSMAQTQPSGTNAVYPADLLVNGLPWEAGYWYGVAVTITFPDGSPFATITDWYYFEVTKQTLTIDWAGDQTVTYDGEKHGFTATATNEIYKNSMADDQLVAVPTLYVSMTSTKNALPADARDTAYTLYAYIDTDTDDGNFKLPDTRPSRALTIIQREVQLNVVASNTYRSVYGNPLQHTNATWAYVDGVAAEHKFVESDTSGLITYKLYSIGTGETLGAVVNAAKPDAASYYIVPVLVNANGNYTITYNYKSAAYTVEQRDITVALNTENAKSVYYTDIDLYADGVYSVTWNNRDGQTSDWLVEANVTDVFTLSTAAAKQSNVGTYPVTLTKVSDNYNITYTAADWEITEAEITAASVATINDVIYKGTGYNIIGELVNASVELINDTANRASVKWFYKKSADADWTEITSATLTDSINENYQFKVTADNHEDKEVGSCDVVINKATLTVAPAMTIKYGEQSPASYNGGCYNATVAHLSNPADSSITYAISGYVNGETLTSIGGISGSYTYTTTYVQGDAASTYAITFVPSNLEAENYVFANAVDSDGASVGRLTVAKLDLTVTVTHIQTAYYTQYATSLFDGHVTISLPNSTYTGAPLTDAELATSVNAALTNDAGGYVGADIFALTTEAYTANNGSGKTKIVGAYAITGAVKAAVENNYSITLVGAKTHEIVKANLAVNVNINGYTAVYDEKQHDAIVDNEGSVIALNAFAAASDGTAITVTFHAEALVSGNPAVATATEWAQWTADSAVLAANPQYIDVCRMAVYYRIDAGSNYNVVYDSKVVEITKAQNSVTNIDDIKVNGWTYGLQSGDNVNGYDASKLPTEPETLFKRLTDTTDNTIKLVLTRNGSAIEGLTGEYSTFAALYDYMWNNGLFTAGEYTLVITMDGTDSYSAWNNIDCTFTFTVAKKELTVTADDRSLVYGSDVPTYTYKVTGFVMNRVGGSLETISVLDKDGVDGDKHSFFTSAYAAGRANGSVGSYAIIHVDGDGNVIDGLTTLTLDNYTLSFVAGDLEIYKREVTITINDRKNTYNLNKGTETAGKLTFEVASELSFYEFDKQKTYDNDNQSVIILKTIALKGENGIRTNDVIVLERNDNNFTLGSYPIYAVYGNYEDGGSYSINYDIKFSDCSYKGSIASDMLLDSADEPITGGGSNAGNFEIRQAVLSIQNNGLFYTNDGGDAVRTGINAGFYSGKAHYIDAVVPSDPSLKIDFIYQILENGSYRNLTEDEEVINVGSYRALGVCTSDNYFASEAVYDITILKASLVLQANDTTIQYGTKLECTPNVTRAEGVVYDASSRFDGFSFAVIITDDAATQQLQPSVIAKYLSEHIVSYTSGEYTPSTVVGQGCYITPVCDSDDNISVTCANGNLAVVKRQVAVTLNGITQGNALAQCDYLGVQADHQAKLTEAYTNNWSSFIEVDDIGFSGDALSALAITFALPSGATKAGTYGMAVSSGESNYAVRFATTAGNVDAIGDKDDYAPKFVINKAKLTIYAHSVVNNKVPQTYSVVYGNTLTYSYSVSGMQNGENFLSLIHSAEVADSGITYTVKCGNKEFAPWLSNVGEEYTVTVNPFIFELDNYELDADKGATYVTTTLAITPRVITVSTTNQEYDWDGNNYHGGAYGKAHNAQLTYSDVSSPNNTEIRQNINGTYKPSIAALSYDTEANTSLNQAKYAAPTTVGEYRVTVTLTGSNYLFDLSGSAGKSVTLDFNVTKHEISEDNLLWDNPSIIDQGEETVGHNVINSFIKDIMDVRLFTYAAYGQTGSVDINYGSSSIANTYYFDGQALAINANGRGRYEVQIQFKETATANYVFKSSHGVRIVSTFTVTSSSIAMTLTIEDWVYNEQPKAPQATVNGVSNDGVRFTYARVTDTSNIDKFYKEPASSSIDNLKVGNYGDISTMVFNAAYYVVLAKYEGVVIGKDGNEEPQVAQLYYVFRVTPAKVELPVANTSDYTFNGQEQALTIQYNTLLVRASYDGHTGTNDNGMVAYATNAGTYEVTFALSNNNNYVWNTGETVDGITVVDSIVTLSWTIAKDNQANSSDILSMLENNTATYGSVRLNGNAIVTAGYDVNSYVTSSWAKDEGQSASAVAAWNNGLPTDAGDYHIRLTLTDSANKNFADKNIYVKLHVNKLEATVTASGSVTYGNDWQTSDTINYTYSQLAYASHRVTGTAAYELADNYGKLEVNREYYIVVANDEGIARNLKVMDNGTDVSANYILKVAPGRLTVNRRNITVTLGNATSQYGRPIDISEVRKTYGQGQLVEGDDLNLALSTTALRSDGTHSVVGGYTITATYKNSNYNATIIAGTYTITERRITVELSEGGGEYGNVKPVTYGKVFDDDNVDITSFVTDKLTLSIIYTGMDNSGTSYSSKTTPTKAGTYIATVQGSGNGNFIIVGEPYIQFVIDKKELDSSKIVIAPQTYTGSALEPVIDNSDFVAAYGDNLYDELEHGEFIIAGSHTVTIRLKDQSNYKWLLADVAERELTFVIDKADNELTSTITISGWIYGEYDIQANLPATTVKFGQDYIVFTYCNNVNGVYTSGAPTTGDVGEYYVRATVPASDNYNAFESAPVKFAISKKTLAQPTLTRVTDGEGKNDVYTGDELLSAIIGFDWSLMDLNCEGKFNVVDSNVVLVAINAGTYTVSVSIRNINNYRFADTTDNTINLSWTVAPKAIAKPTENKSTFMVNGQILTYIPEGFDEETMTIEDNQTAYGGKFYVKIGLKDKANYVWTEGGADDFDLVWNVIGTNTVFYIVVGTLSGTSVVAILAAGIQLLMDKRKKRLNDRAIDERSQAEAETENVASETNTDDNDKGGND